MKFSRDFGTRSITQILKPVACIIRHLQPISTKYILTNKELKRPHITTLECEISKFRFEPYGHIINGGLNIVGDQLPIKIS